MKNGIIIGIVLCAIAVTAAGLFAPVDWRMVSGLGSLLASVVALLLALDGRQKDEIASAHSALTAALDLVDRAQSQCRWYLEEAVPIDRVRRLLMGGDSGHEVVDSAASHRGEIEMERRALSLQLSLAAQRLMTKAAFVRGKSVLRRDLLKRAADSMEQASMALDQLPDLLEMIRTGEREHGKSAKEAAEKSSLRSTFSIKAQAKLIDTKAWSELSEARAGLINIVSELHE